MEENCATSNKIEDTAHWVSGCQETKKTALDYWWPCTKDLWILSMVYKSSQTQPGPAQV